jgi:plastocyanin
MRRLISGTVMMVAALALVGEAPIAAGASGGGGCGRAVSDERGTTVRIKNFCFLPTILRIHPGQAVTFENRDGFAHVVLGANAVWGSFSQVRGHHDVRYRFTRPGVYPYVCTFHPGMVGAVVVGNGAGHGEATAVVTAAGPVVPLDGPAAADRTTDGVATAPVPASGQSWIAPWQLVALTVFAAGVTAFAIVDRRRGRRLAA